MNRAEIITPWIGSGTSADPNRPQLPSDHAITSFEDRTGQPSENLQPDPNLFVVLAEMTDAVLASIEADSTYEVLWSEMIPEPLFPDP